jgi:hypothetical protein
MMCVKVGMATRFVESFGLIAIGVFWRFVAFLFWLNWVNWVRFFTDDEEIRMRIRLGVSF